MLGLIKTVRGYDKLIGINIFAGIASVNGRVQSRYYDILGQIVEEEKGGIAVRYAYDAQGRMISASRYRVSAGIGGAETVTTCYAYDSYGRQSIIDYGTHKVSFTYDLNDNVLSESRISNDGTVENTTSYTYDENGNVLTLTRNGETISFGYNAEGSSTSVVYDDISMSWSYDDNGNVNAASVTKYMGNASPKSYWRNYYYIDGQPTTVLEYRNASNYIFRNYGYDDEGNLTVLNHGNRSYGWDEKHRVYYDDEGRIVTENMLDGFTDEVIRSKTYTYDWLGRLVTETVDGVVTTYTYDNVGNIRTKTTGDITTTYNYNTLDQLQNIQTSDSVIQASYTYDLSGNRASMTSYGNTVTYTYDGQNNMTSSGGITYTYDAKGERLTKTVGSDTYSYYYNGVNLLFTKKNGEFENKYFYAGDEVYGAIAADGTAYWYCTDVRGSVSSIHRGTTESNTTTELDTSYVYDAYGETVYTIEENSTYNNAIAYTGAILDKETGLYYLMSRYYDPALAQFISEDSYRGDGEAFWHLYAYCDGDPVNRTDRTGRAYVIDDAAAIGLTVVAVAAIIALTAYISSPGFQKAWSNVASSISSSISRSWKSITNSISKAYTWTATKVKLLTTAVATTYTIAKADAKIRTRVKRKSNIRYWTATVRTSYVDIGRGISFSAAVRELRLGRSIFAVTKYEARMAAYAVHNRQPVGPENHSKNTMGYYWHYHAYGRKPHGGHAYYLFT